MTKTLSRLAKGKAPIRRHIRVQARNGSQIISSVQSFTKNDGTRYNPSIDVKSLEFFCDCPDHHFRHNFCKHLRKTALNLIRRGELDSSFLAKHCGKSCCRCKVEGKVEALFPMCHDDGELMDGVSICFPCIENLRAEQRGATNAPSAREVVANTEIEPFPDDDELTMTVCARGHITFSDEAPCGCEHESEAEDAEPSRVSNCPCGRRFPGRDFDHVCPSCKITLRAAWQRHWVPALRSVEFYAAYFQGAGA